MGKKIEKKSEKKLTRPQEITHDYHAVRVYEDLVEHEPKKSGINFSQKIVFPNGCGPFAHQAANELEINYYGSEHGKSNWDAENRVINTAQDRAIITIKVVTNYAEEILQKSLVNDILTERRFYFVNKEDINRLPVSIKPISQTRKTHQICNIPETQEVFLFL